MRIFLILFISCFVLLVFPHGIYGDGTVRLEFLQFLIEQKRISHMKYSLVGPLFAAPFYLLGFVVKNPWWWCARFNSFLFFILASFLWRFCRPFTTERQRIFMILSLLCASMFPKHLGDFYGEVFTCTFVVMGLCLFAEDRRWRGASLVMLGALNTPATLPAFFLLLIWICYKERKSNFLLFIPLSVSLFCLDNYLRLGTWLHAYGELEKSAPSILPYSNIPGFSYPLFFGLLSLVFSFGKGLAFFIPGFFYYLYHRRKSEIPVALRFVLDGLAIFCICLIFTYARWWAWGGSWFWGPRFFLLACVPAALFLGLRLSEKPKNYWESAVLVSVSALSFWAGADSVAFDQSNLEACGLKDMDFLCLYVPEFSSLWRPFVVNPGFHGKSFAYLVFFFIVFLALNKNHLLFLCRRSKRRITYLLGRELKGLERWSS